MRYREGLGEAETEKKESKDYLHTRSIVVDTDDSEILMYSGADSSYNDICTLLLDPDIPRIRFELRSF